MWVEEEEEHRKLWAGVLPGSPALGADTAGAALDLTVHVQEAREVTPGLLRADLWGHQQGWARAAEGVPSPPFPDHSMPCHSLATW